MEYQLTIKNEVSISGVGLHTGNNVTLNFKPAPVNHGISFKRIDLESEPLIEASASYVTDTERSTTICKNGVKIQTPEHFLAACAGLKIDNILIEINAEELPILDGSSIEYIKCLKKAELHKQNALRKYFVIKEEINFEDPETGAKIQALPADELSISVQIDYESKVLGNQTAELKNIEQFETEFSDARTFCFLHELELLSKNDLIKGGDLSNAIVYVERETDEDELKRIGELFNIKSVKISEDGYLNNLNLKYNNEAARHKLLDVIGDLALLGTRIKGKVIANKPGHFVNTSFAKHLSSHIKKEKRNLVSGIDLSKPPLMDVKQIEEILPHRPPFVFIDKILELSDKHVVALKNVTMNEDFFKGHFPGKPIMPGVLQIEAMAQAGGVLILSTVPDPQNYLTFFAKIDNAKFKFPVVPGDTLIFKCELLSPLRRGMSLMKAQAFVDGRLTTEAELMAKIVKKSEA